ncbi:hypothetical protein N7532_001726 [Penicillium argentinense]|uniref:FAR1 domain-containing protein n=1 Tax=Penicillium argentinense TaxID=1131581 RepID=A0A9W9G328_9EURO|nr:uncharacterized protein N7532_001726 [Penicillium argentinense]KAJ5111191.1 hypothetical protein N7532_001726 [Penicillium argentinense]
MPEVAGIVSEDTDEDPATFRITLPLPPLDRRYNTPEEGIEAINQLGFNNGFAVVKRRSKKTKGQVPRLKKVQLQCDRGGQALEHPKEAPEQPEQAPVASGRSKKRKTHSLAIDCPFDISLRLQDDEKWILTITSDKHNHKPSPATTHVAHRKHELAQKREQLQNWFKQNLPTRQILRLLRAEDKRTCLLPKDINNARMRMNDEFLAGQTPIQALLMELPTDGEWRFRYTIHFYYDTVHFYC